MIARLNRHETKLVEREYKHRKLAKEGVTLNAFVNLLVRYGLTAAALENAGEIYIRNLDGRMAFVSPGKRP